MKRKSTGGTPRALERGRSGVRLGGSVLASLLLVACAPAPVLPSLTSASPEAFRHSGELPVVVADTLATAPDAWWQAFGERELDALVARASVGNESVRAAAARASAARAILAGQQAQLWPSLGASAGAARSDAGRQASPASRYSLGADASWEVDLWGRVQQAITRGEASLGASIADEAGLRFSLQASVVQTWLQLRGTERRNALLDRSVEIARRLLELSQARYEAGVVGRADVLQAQTQLASTEVQRSQLRLDRAQLEHALALLVGVAPTDLVLPASAHLPAVPALPALLPARVLARRPDIAAARYRVLASHAAIGVAESAGLPRLTLSASSGFAGTAPGGLISAPALAWSLGAALAQTIFDGGQIDAAAAQARAEAEESLANYRQLVLQSFVEVEDNLVAVDQLHQQAALQETAVDAARRTLGIVEAQYREGTVSFLNVATAQSQLQSAEIGLADAHLRVLIASASLLKNAGGRWQPPVAADME